MDYVKMVSLNELIYDDDGRAVCLEDLLEDQRPSVEDRIMTSDLVDRLPVTIREIGDKLVSGTALTSLERKRLQRFRQKCPCRDAIGEKNRKGEEYAYNTQQGRN